jgi:hypothetical protein
VQECPRRRNIDGKVFRRHQGAIAQIRDRRGRLGGTGPGGRATISSLSANEGAPGVKEQH